MPDALRLMYVESIDLRALFQPDAGPDATAAGGLAAVVSPSTAIEISSIDAGGWGSTLDLLRTGPAAAGGRFNVLLTSASAELEDPSREPREVLVGLARSVRERFEAHVVVLNASTVPSASTGGSLGSEADEPLDLRIRRVNLAIMEASHETGLSVLDADRLVAETSLPDKVIEPFAYAPEINGMLRAMLASILDELGFAQRAVMGARVPFIRQVAAMSIQEWLKSEGEVVATGDVLCRLRLKGIRRFRRPSNAAVLASINGHVPILRRIVNREGVHGRHLDAVVSLVAGDGAILRKVARPAGAAVRPGDLLAVLSRDAATPIDDADLRASHFRAAIRADDATLEALL